MITEANKQDLRDALVHAFPYADPQNFEDDGILQMENCVVGKKDLRVILYVADQLELNVEITPLNGGIFFRYFI